MANEFQAGKMILSDIGMFNEAVNLFSNVVEPALLGAVDECVEAFAKTEQWIGGFELAGDESECWLAPAQWHVDEENTDLRSKASFSICNIHGDDDYWTALLCNQGSTGGEAGFMFYADQGTYGKKRAWNKFFGTIDQSVTDELKKLGFKIVDADQGYRTFFLPIRLDAATLAATWGNDGDFSETDTCFKPVKDALETIKTAWPLFDSILNACPVRP